MLDKCNWKFLRMSAQAHVCLICQLHVDFSLKLSFESQFILIKFGMKDLLLVNEIELHIRRFHLQREIHCEYE